MTLPTIVESGLNEAGTAVAVIVYPERGVGAIIEYANQPFSAVIHRSAAELTGATLQVLLDLIDQDECRKRLLESLQSGNTVQLDVPLKLDGIENWFGVRISYPPPGVSGVRYAILIGRDITQARKNATQEDKMRQLLAQIFMRINAPVVIVGRSGEVVMSNTAFRQLLGFSAEELKRMRVADLTAPHYVDFLAKAHETQFRDGKQFELEFEIMVRGGAQLPARLTSVLLSDSGQSYRVVTLLAHKPRDEEPVIAAAALATVFSSNTALDRGELRALSLEALRASFGSTWERIALRAMLLAEQSIRKRLKHEDILTRLNECEFGIWFSGEDEKHNRTTLAAIVRDVRLAFLTEFGEELGKHVSATLIPGIEPQPAVDPSPAAGKVAPYSLATRQREGQDARKVAWK